MGIDKAIDVAIVLLSKHATLKVKRTALKIDEIHFAAAARHDSACNFDLMLVGGLVCTSAVRCIHAGFSHVIGKLIRNVIYIVGHFCRLATIISYQILVLILQRLRTSDLIRTRIRIRDCKLGTIAHIEKRLIIARVLYLAAIKIKGDIATTLENNLFVAV
ncbi:hypothetical protein DW195_00300 [Collinsella sp. AM17-1]|nr:hypothetical protein DW195_00300 [Collinsella sp. AM17-1]